MITLRLALPVRGSRRRLKQGRAWWLVGFWAGCALAAFAAPANGNELAPPDGRVVLTVTGNISNTNAGNAAQFDRAMLAALPKHIVETETPWTDGTRRFEGPLMRDVLQLVGAHGSRIAVLAINDYSIEIPVADFDSYPVILALTMDGDALHTRNRGPLWIIYPWRNHPELRNQVYYGRSVWQVKEIAVVD